jgi:hypothetical protein
MRMKNLTGYDIEDVLELIGLARRRSVLGTMVPVIGYVALGAALGAGIGLMFAPSSGRRLRQEVGDRLDQMRERVKTEAKKQGIVNNATTIQS